MGSPPIPERPKQIPPNWICEQLPDAKGWRWSDPANRNNAVRIYDGDSHSERLEDQSPYVIITVNGELIGSDSQKLGEFLYD